MNILITGGAGYLGSALTQALSQLKQVNQVTIYDNLSRGNYNIFMSQKLAHGEKIRFVQADILDSRKLKKYVAEADWVFHLAAKVTTPFSDHYAHLYEQVNHWGTAEVTYAVEQSEVQGLVYLSSTSVYGSGTEILDVEAPLNPRTFYGISKMRGEEHVSRLASKCGVYVLRCGNVYGVGSAMRFDAVINKFMFEAHFNKKVSINGNGDQRRSFICLSKVTDLLAAILGNQVNSGTYNVVAQHLSVMDIAQSIKSLYPDLEMIFVNHHMQMREQVVHPDSRLGEFLNETNFNLASELARFKSQFAF